MRCRTPRRAGRPGIRACASRMPRHHRIVQGPRGTSARSRAARRRRPHGLRKCSPQCTTRGRHAELRGVGSTRCRAPSSAPSRKGSRWPPCGSSRLTRPSAALDRRVPPRRCVRRRHAPRSPRSLVEEAVLSDDGRVHDEHLFGRSARRRVVGVSLLRDSTRSLSADLGSQRWTEEREKGTRCGGSRPGRSDGPARESRCCRAPLLVKPP